MANTYLRILLHIVFAAKNHKSLIENMYLTELHSYIGGIIRQHGHMPLAIGGTSSHVHILLSLSATEPLMILMRDIKTSTNRFINTRQLSIGRFEWQRGYAAFSFSYIHLGKLTEYVTNQLEHHHGMNIRDEIKRLCERNGVAYEEAYIFDNPEG